mmetsp:Transcript_16906/g.30666  ORF Transcript_16906/g.30666 Transcript_16906/m.30666 type:complete len:111 (-) Transcript_16906:256-588(-)
MSHHCPCLRQFSKQVSKRIMYTSGHGARSEYGPDSQRRNHAILCLFEIRRTRELFCRSQREDAQERIGEVWKDIQAWDSPSLNFPGIREERCVWVGSSVVSILPNIIILI